MAAQLDPLVSEVLEKFEAADSARRPVEERWMKAYKLYRSYKEELPEEDRDLANLFIPKTFSDIESITPRLVMSSIARRPWVTVKPRSKDDIPKAKAFTSLLQAQFDKNKMFRKLVMYYKQALIYGTSPAFIGWRIEKKVRRVRKFRDRIVAGVNLTQLRGFRQVPYEEEQVVTLWDDPEFVPLDIWDFYPDPDGVSIEDMGYIIHRQWISAAEMEAAGIYENIEEAKRTALGEAGNRAAEERRKEVGLTPGYTGPRTRPIELLHLWEDGRVVTIANRSVVVRHLEGKDYPYYHGRKPFTAIVDTPVPFEFWGIGTALATADLQEELNTRRNQRLDAATLATHRMFVVARNANINPNDLVWRAGGVIYVDDLGDVNKMIKVLDMPDVSRSAYEEELLIHRDMEQTNAVSDFLRGTITDERRTATEINQAALGANARVELKIRLMADMGLKEIAEHFVELDQQFITEERVVRVLGQDRRDEWVDIKPSDLQIVPDDLIPAASNVETWANRVQTRQDLERFMQIVGRAPVFLQFLNIRKILEKLVETFEFADVDSVLIEEEQATELQRQIQQLFLQQGMMGGGGGGQPGDLMQVIQQGLRGRGDEAGGQV